MLSSQPSAVTNSGVDREGLAPRLNQLVSQVAQSLQTGMASQLSQLEVRVPCHRGQLPCGGHRGEFHQPPNGLSRRLLGQIVPDKPEISPQALNGQLVLTSELS